MVGEPVVACDVERLWLRVMMPVVARRVSWALLCDVELCCGAVPWCCDHE